jgi:hypothetical protein
LKSRMREKCINLFARVGAQLRNLPRRKMMTGEIVTMTKFMLSHTSCFYVYTVSVIGLCRVKLKVHAPTNHRRTHYLMLTNGWRIKLTCGISII